MSADKHNIFATCLRVYRKMEGTWGSYENAEGEWLMYKEYLEEENLMEDFEKYYKAQNKKDNDLWNELVARRERKLKEND